MNQLVVVQTDASLEGLGAVFLQEEQPVSYGSRSLTDSEKNYAPIELELLAIIYGMQKYDQCFFWKPRCNCTHGSPPFRNL